jgi:hypothetical protein
MKEYGKLEKGVPGTSMPPYGSFREREDELCGGPSLPGFHQGRKDRQKVFTPLIKPAVALA